MKDVRVTFTDDEHEQLSDEKGEDRSWHDAMLEEFGVSDS